jgi:nicotinamide-nucleotide amidase
MTGGGIGERLTSVPGSSKAYKGGFVTYIPEAKMSMLDLSSELISSHGPVSIQVAEAMSQAVRQKLNTTYGIAIVGNAGPTSDIDGKPVGLVIVSISGPQGTTSDTSNFRGIREDIRKRGEQTALRLLRGQVLES